MTDIPDSVPTESPDCNRTSGFQVNIPYLSQPEAAEILRVSPRTLERWRIEPPKGGNPLPFVRAGRRILYRREDINAFVEARLFTNTTEAEAWEGRSHD